LNFSYMEKTCKISNLKMSEIFIIHYNIGSQGVPKGIYVYKCSNYYIILVFIETGILANYWQTHRYKK